LFEIPFSALLLFAVSFRMKKDVLRIVFKESLVFCCRLPHSHLYPRNTSRFTNEKSIFPVCKFLFCASFLKDKCAFEIILSILIDDWLDCVQGENCSRFEFIVMTVCANPRDFFFVIEIFLVFYVFKALIFTNCTFFVGF
jgi:hypothetical protein